MKKLTLFLALAIMLSATTSDAGIFSRKKKVTKEAGGITTEHVNATETEQLTNARIGLGIATLLDSMAQNPERFGTVASGALETWGKINIAPGQENKRIEIRHDSRDKSLTERMIGSGSGGNGSNSADVVFQTSATNPNIPPGSVFDGRDYFLSPEDPTHCLRLSKSDAERSWESAEVRQDVINDINAELMRRARKK